MKKQKERRRRDWTKTFAGVIAIVLAFTLLFSVIASAILYSRAAVVADVAQEASHTLLWEQV